MLKYVLFLILIFFASCYTSSHTTNTNLQDLSLVQPGEVETAIQIDTIFLGVQSTNVIHDLIAESKAAFFLIRHAEKADDGTKDPPLTKKGLLRSKLLSQMFYRVNLTAVYSTNYKRTQSTAEPTAEYFDMTINSYKASDLQDFTKTLLKRHDGENILVVGHSNTTPRLLNALHGDSNVESLDEGDYNNLFLLNFLKDGSRQIISFQFQV